MSVDKSDTAIQAGLMLISFRVTLSENNSTQHIWFDCLAEDESHAIEQTLNMYPNATIHSTTIKTYAPSRKHITSLLMASQNLKKQKQEKES
jgi:hypothetical protein